MAMFIYRRDWIRRNSPTDISGRSARVMHACECAVVTARHTT